MTLQLSDVRTLDESPAVSIYVLKQLGEDLGPSSFRCSGGSGDSCLEAHDRFDAGSPMGFLSADVVAAGDVASPADLVVIEEEATGEEVLTETNVEVLLMDFSQEVLPFLRIFDPQQDSEGILFSQQKAWTFLHSPVSFFQRKIFGFRMGRRTESSATLPQKKRCPRRQQGL